MTISVHRDVVYARHNGFRPLALDLYVPPGAGTLCVYLHGGGWRTGSRREGPGPAASWFFEEVASLGLAVAAVDYRLSGEAVFPAQLDDVQAALRFLRESHRAYGIASDRIVCWGTSAGGQLAALAALAPGSPIAAAVCWYPPTDFDALAKDIEEAGGTGDRSAASREGQLIGAGLDDRPDLAAAASPVNFAHAGAPPFLLLHGTADRAVPPRQSARLASALTRVGAAAIVELIPGATHMFPELDQPAAREVVRRSVSFLL
ncbi:alpha/beta hydrolase [Actinoplanes sp. KI2]|uniref:alpha/beta hydrolase n=1 Tax=Actinoplanes sp. KI2 TaxID=2983315 RepID=UPI0021D5E254|nr:alpha/beta hydrolase [Actinoplanes sp. KI2]MCU7729170.1 alpha/beta hydrolase [Actinoplanes sp. KI2]